MKSLLERPFVYLAYQALVGAKRSRKRVIDEFARPRPGERVFDVGCGPGYVIEYLSEVEYIGTDIDAAYIAYAHRTYGDRGEFRCVELDSENAPAFGDFDLILLNGVLHHVDDPTGIELLRILGARLRPGGRIVTLDGCYVPKMSWISRYLIDHDRGEYVRDETGYRTLAGSAFDRVEVHHRDDLFSVPYDSLVMVLGNPV